MSLRAIHIAADIRELIEAMIENHVRDDEISSLAVSNAEERLTDTLTVFLSKADTEKQNEQESTESHS